MSYRIAISAETLDCPFTRPDSVCRVTSRPAAALVTLKSRGSRHCRLIMPSGCGGLCMVMVTTLIDDRSGNPLPLDHPPVSFRTCWLCRSSVYIRILLVVNVEEGTRQANIMDSQQGGLAHEIGNPWYLLQCPLQLLPDTAIKFIRSDPVRQWNALFQISKLLPNDGIEQISMGKQ